MTALKILWIMLQDRNPVVDTKKMRRFLSAIALKNRFVTSLTLLLPIYIWLNSSISNSIKMVFTTLLNCIGFFKCLRTSKFVVTFCKRYSIFKWFQNLATYTDIKDLYLKFFKSFIDLFNLSILKSLTRR